jgi:pyruvate dehydrogenase complex dehydrogenase (E1) component
MYSNRRADGVLLEALIKARKAEAAVPGSRPRCSATSRAEVDATNALGATALMRSAFEALLKSSEEREMSTTMAFVRILNTIIRDKKIGKFVVPIPRLSILD